MAWVNPITWSAGVLTSANLNTIRDSLKAIGDPWTSYTNTTTNVTLGNGTLTSVYASSGKLVRFRIKLTLGTTSALAGAPNFTLPVAPIGDRTVLADALFYDSSAGSSGYMGGFAFNSSGTTLVLRTDASAIVNATVPFTWATGDELVISGSYEAA